VPADLGKRLRIQRSVFHCGRQIYQGSRSQRILIPKNKIKKNQKNKKNLLTKRFFYDIIILENKERGQ
jgi:hypothetical protein